MSNMVRNCTNIKALCGLTADSDVSTPIPQSVRSCLHQVNINCSEINKILIESHLRAPNLGACSISCKDDP
jgi:hypothetical protein